MIGSCLRASGYTAAERCRLSRRTACPRRRELCISPGRRSSYWFVHRRRSDHRLQGRPDTIAAVLGGILILLGNSLPPFICYINSSYLRPLVVSTHPRVSESLTHRLHRKTNVTSSPNAKSIVIAQWRRDSDRRRLFSTAFPPSTNRPLWLPWRR